DTRGRPPRRGGASCHRHVGRCDVDTTKGPGRRRPGTRIGVLVLTGLVVATPLVTVAVEPVGQASTVTLTTVAKGDPRSLGPPSGAGPTSGQTVTYRGLRLEVPKHWAVHDLTKNPETCVRYDKPAVYLGPPGEEQRCP